MIRYSFVGGIAFAVDFGTLCLCTDGLGLHYLISGIIAFVLGLTVNYYLSLHWVFSHKGSSTTPVRKKGLEFILFALIGVVGLGLNTLILYLLTDVAGFHYLVSKIISTIIVFMWNFVGRRFLMN